MSFLRVALATSVTLNGILAASTTAFADMAKNLAKHINELDLKSIKAEVLKDMPSEDYEARWARRFNQIKREREHPWKCVLNRVSESYGGGPCYYCSDESVTEMGQQIKVWNVQTDENGRLTYANGKYEPYKAK
jgi:hypothetical protein